MLHLSKQTDRLLIEFLRNNNLINDEQQREAEGLSLAMSCSVISSLIDMNVIREEEILETFAHKFGLEKSKTKLSNLKSRPLQDKISDQFVIINRVVPVDVSGDKVYVVVSDPSALDAFNNMQVISDTKVVEASVVSLYEMEDYIERLKSKMDDDFLRTLEAAESGDESAIEEMAHQLGQKKNENHDYLLGIAAEEARPKGRPRINAGSDVIEFVDSIISNAITLGVSDIHIESFRSSAQVRYRKDGVLQLMDEFEEFLTYNYSAVVARIKILASLDISERRLPQDGAITSALAEKTVDLRVSVLPAVHGERVVMRILDPEAANFSLDDLGIEASALKKFRKAINSPQGMILVTGPTGSGKSTTLYAALKELNSPGTNILTAEDPVEYDLKGIGQVQVRENIGYTFSSALRSFLRQDPEIIMVGEIRDKETSDIAIKASLTGHLVLSTLHTNSAISTITRLINIGIPSYLITSSVTLVLAQRLARVNCPHCLEDDVNAVKDVLLDIGFSEEDIPSIKPKKSKGCDRCLDTGVKGRVGVHEVLYITPAIREAILNGASEAELTDIAKKDGYNEMEVVGKNFVRSGKISVYEYKRILVLD